MMNEKRIQQLTIELKKAGLSGIFLGPSSDLEYIAGLRLFPDERTKGVLIAESGLSFALTPMLYGEDMKNALGEATRYFIWADHDGFQKAFAEGCRYLGIDKGQIAVNDGVLAVDLLDMMQSVPAEFKNGKKILEPIRRKKDEQELDFMREASRIADRVMAKVQAFLQVGVTEGEVQEKIETFFMEEGSHGLSFSPIVAAGPNGSMPHYTGTSRVIEKGDFVVVDMGGIYRGYCSDITRTFCMGAPTEEQKEVYSVVLEAQKQGEKAVVAGASGQDVDRAARQIIEKAGYGEHFLNRVGHGIGIAVHEAPYIIEGNSAVLEPGNVFSIEPGIYIPGKFGIRIENLVAVREDGSGEALNSFSRELTIIDC